MASKRDRERREPKYNDAKQRAVAHEESRNLSGAYRVPKGMNIFQVKSAKKYSLDFVPYEVKNGKENKGGNPFCESGFLHYERTFYVHRGIGPEQNTYCCLAKTFGKKCPICEDAARMRKDPDADKDEIKALNPKERQLFLVIDRGDEDRGVQLWDFSNFLFGEVLDSKIADSEEEDNYHKFYYLKDGMTVRVSFSEESMGSNTFYKAKNIEMRKRSEDLPASLLDEVPDLDALLIEMPYDKLKAIYLQMDPEDAGGDDDEEKLAPKRNLAAKKEEDDEEEDDEEEDDDEDEDSNPAKKKGIKVGTIVEHSEHGECEVMHVSADGTSLRLKDEEGTLHKACDPNDCKVDAGGKDDDDDDDDEEEEERPVKPARGKKPAVKDDDDEEDDEEEDDDWEDDEEDEPPAKPKRGKK